MKPNPSRMLLSWLAFAGGIASANAQALQPGDHVAAVWGRLVPATTSIQVFHPFGGTATRLSIAGYPLAAGELPFSVTVESTTAFLLGSGVPQVNLGGNVYRVVWTGTAWQATRLNAATLPVVASSMVPMGADIYVMGTDNLGAGGFSAELWKVPTAGGPATQVVDFAALGSRGLGAGLAAIGPVLHASTYDSSVGGPPGEHWSVDTSTMPPTVSRVGSLPRSLRTGANNANLGAGRMVADNNGRLVIAGVHGDVLWRTPTGQNLRHRTLPGPLVLDTDYLGGLAINTNTGAVGFGDKDSHFEELRCEGGAFRLDAITSAGIPAGGWVMGLAYVPGLVDYLPTEPGCALGTGLVPCSYANSLPAQGNIGFWLTLDATSSPAILILGTQSAQIDLTPFGAPGCVVGTVPLATQFWFTARPSALFPLPAGIAGTLYTQWAVPDPSNALGLVFSDTRRLAM